MPYNPGVVDRSGEFIAQGITGASNAIEARIGQWKNIQLEAKAADYFYQAHPEMFPDVHTEQWKILGAGPKIAAAHAVMQNQALQDMMAKRKDLESQATERTSIANWRNAQATRLEEEDKGAASMLDTLAGLGRPTPARLNPASVQEMMTSFGPAREPAVLPAAPAQAHWSPEVQAILESGAAMGRSNSRVASTVLKEVLPQVMGEANGKRSNFFEKDNVAQDIPGMPGFKRVITGPNTSTVQYMGEDVGVPTPQHDDTGNLVGYSMRDARGHSTFTKAKSEASITVAKDEEGNAIPGYYRMGDKIIDARTALQKMVGEEGGPPAAGGKTVKKKLTSDQAKQYLEAAGGNKEQARAKAMADGYTF